MMSLAPSGILFEISADRFGACRKFNGVPSVKVTLTAWPGTKAVEHLDDSKFVIELRLDPKK